MRARRRSRCGPLARSRLLGLKLVGLKLVPLKVARAWLQVPVPGTIAELAPRILVRRNLAPVVRYSSSKAI